MLEKGRETPMTEKELRKLGRSDLLSLLLEQGQENQRLREQLLAAQKALADRTICIDEAGSIAEASLRLNGVFEAAEQACRQYTDSIRQLSRRQEEICAQREKESREKAAQIIEDAQKQAAETTERTQKQCGDMLEEAKAESQKYWDDVSNRLASLLDEHAELRQLLTRIPSQERGGKQ